MYLYVQPKLIKHHTQGISTKEIFKQVLEQPAHDLITQELNLLFNHIVVIFENQRFDFTNKEPLFD